MLEVSNLTAIRDERVLFENLQFEIKPGELVQIEGVMAQVKRRYCALLQG